MLALFQFPGFKFTGLEDDCGLLQFACRFPVVLRRPPSSLAEAGMFPSLEYTFPVPARDVSESSHMRRFSWRLDHTGKESLEE
jgi:hypothetical protein